MLKTFSTRLILISLFFFISCMGLGRTVFVEGVAINPTEMEYRLTVMSEEGKRVIHRESNPVDLIEFKGDKSTYIDREGDVWQTDLTGESRKLLFKTGNPVRSDVVNRFLMSGDGKALFYFENSMPERLAETDSTFDFIQITGVDHKRLIASCKGKAYVIGRYSDQIIRVVSSKQTLNYFVKDNSVKTDQTEICGPSTVYYSMNYKINECHNGGTWHIEVIDINSSRAIIKFDIKNGFGLFSDFIEREKKLLVIKVPSAKDTGNSLIVISPDFPGGREIYHGDLIGSACFND
jgi:hypothetical protein